MNEMNDMAKEEAKKPEFDVRAGGVKVTVWKNEGKGKKGEYSFLSAVPVRSYKDGDDWKETNSYQASDLAKLIVVLQEAYRRMVINQKADEDAE